jgi:excisionase family DNA binding protein
MAPEEGWVGIEDVAAHLRVAKESIYRWVDSKGFPAHRVGRLLRFKLSEVDEWVMASGGASDEGPRSSGSRPRKAKP